MFRYKPAEKYPLTASSGGAAVHHHNLRILWLLIAGIVLCAIIGSLWWQHAISASPNIYHSQATLPLPASTAADNAVPHASLQVNNQSITLPTIGTVHKEIDNTNGKTTIDVSVDSSSTGTTSSSSSLNVDVHSSSSSNTEGTP